MTFQQLTYLLEVNRTGSFTAAAKILFVAQSTVSNAITALEIEIGTPIFVRGKKGLYPTPRGEEIIAHAGRIQDSYQFMTSGRISEKRSLRICCNTYTPANAAFLRLLEENKGEDVDYSFVNHNYINAFNALINYELDLSIHMVFSPNTPAFEEKIKRHSLNYQIIATVPVAICIGPGHRLYSQESVSMQDFKEDKLLELPSPDYSIIEYLNASATYTLVEVFGRKGLSRNIKIGNIELEYSTQRVAHHLLLSPLGCHLAGKQFTDNIYLLF